MNDQRDIPQEHLIAAEQEQHLSSDLATFAAFEDEFPEDEENEDG